MIKKLFFILLSITTLLLIMEFVPETVSSTIDNRFDLNGEANIPAWFSTILLFSISIASWWLYQLEKSTKNNKMQKFWAIFSGIYCFLSLDEAARIHEISDSLNVKWIFIYAPLGLLFFAYCTYTLFQYGCSRRLRYWILGGLIFYALGGLCGEIIDYVFGRSQLVVLYEESFEFLGIIAVLRGCLQEVEARYQEFLKAKLQ